MLFNYNHDAKKHKRIVQSIQNKHIHMGVTYKEAYGPTIYDNALYLINNDKVTTNDYRTFYISDIIDDKCHYVVSKDSNDQYSCSCNNDDCCHSIASSFYCDSRDVTLKYLYSNTISDFRNYFILNRSIILIKVKHIFDEYKLFVMSINELSTIHNMINDLSEYDLIECCSNDNNVDIFIRKSNIKHPFLNNLFSYIDDVTSEFHKESPYVIEYKITIIIN